MRTTPAGLHSAALVAFDGKVRACLESIGCFPVPDRIWQQATLGVKHGGLGLRQCAVHATAAYLASVATTQEACRGLDGRYNPDWPISSATAATYNAVVLEADRFRGDQAHRQQALSAALDKAQLAQLLVTAEDASGRAHLQLLQQPAAGAWLLARPSPALGLDLDPAFFRVLLRLRLRIPVASSDGYCHLLPLVQRDRGPLWRSRTGLPVRWGPYKTSQPPSNSFGCQSHCCWAQPRG